MAHLVENMAFANHIPWHGLGFHMPQDAPLEEWIIRAGLDWLVEKKQVLYNETAAKSDRLRTFKDKFVLVRTTDEHPFAVVSTRYRPVQPKEILEFYRDLASMHGMTIETAGSLKHGARVWALAKTGNVHKVLGRDQVEGYLLLATSYDATFSTMAQFTSVRVVCNNTLELSFKNFSGRVSIPHTQVFDANAVKAEMGIGKEAWESFVAATEALAKAKVDDAQAAAFVRGLFKVDPIKQMEEMTPEELVDYNHADNVLQMFKSTAPAAQLAGRTAWGLVNAVSGYIDHSKRARGDAGRLDSAWFGTGAAIKRQAMNDALLLAA